MKVSDGSSAVLDDLGPNRCGSDSSKNNVLGFAGLGLLDGLNADPRPTFVVDLASTEGSVGKPPVTIFSNAALDKLPSLRRIARNEVSHQTADSTLFLSWVSRPSHPHIQYEVTTFSGFDWISYILQGRYKVISASRPHTSIHEDQDAKVPSTAFSSSPSNLAYASVDDIQHPKRNIDGALFQELTPTKPTQIPAPSSNHIQWAKSYDWSSTSLGAMEDWTPRIRQIVNFMLHDPNPGVVFLGDDLITIYNQGTIPVLVDRHPEIFGKPAKEFLFNQWDSYFKSLFENVIINRQTIQVHNMPMSLRQDQGLREIFISFTYMPILGSDDDVLGVYENFSDVTSQNITQRRIQTLAEVTASMSDLSDSKVVWKSVLEGISNNDKDLPQALAFSVLAEESDAPDSMRPVKFLLEGSLGYKSPSYHGDYEIADNVAAMFRNAITTNELIQITDKDESLFPLLTAGFETRGFADTCKAVIVCPIRPVSRRTASGILVLGLNARLPFDESYRDFIHLLRTGILSALASTLLLEEEVRRGKAIAQQAALDHDDLNAQLDIQKESVRASQARFSRFVKHAPIGICIYAPDGSMMFANPVWYSMTQFPKDADATGSEWWSDLVFPEDLAHAGEMFMSLLVGLIPVTFEVRLRPPSKGGVRPEGNPHIWTLCDAYPELRKDGSLESVVACFTDITEQKKAEESQRQQVVDAIEAKRQHENFIDITCHEIRNPLSVVLQCGVDIITSCAEIAKSNGAVASEALNNIADAAETIEYCTLHQKWIIDDILTLSKMSSGLLSVTPKRCQPLAITKDILKAFERETRISEVAMSFEAEKSLYDFKLEWAELDPVRLSQMLINLTSNAIKFTKTQSLRKITVKLGAFDVETLEAEAKTLNYLPRLPAAAEKCVGYDWRPEETVFLRITVEDTGNGMTAEEQKSLFLKFSQASPRTHVEYGGSGLGLYISRNLAERHGGQIGFNSSSGEGSVFGFYIKVRRLQPTISDTGSVVVAESSPSKRLKINLNHTNIPPCPLGKSGEASFDVMVVEDNLINQKVLKRQLEKRGHTVMVANHGQECLDLLEKTQFWKSNQAGAKLSVILMDIEMPTLDGLECTKRIRELEAAGLVRGHVPIIAITGNAREEQVQLALASGMDRVVLKPFTLSDLLPLIVELDGLYCRKESVNGEP